MKITSFNDSRAARLGLILILLCLLMGGVSAQDTTPDGSPRRFDDPAAPALPSSFALLSPQPAVTLADPDTIILSWTALPNAQWYRVRLVQVRPNQRAKSILNQRLRDLALICADGVCTLNLSSFNVRLKADKRYRWWVEAKVAGQKQPFKTEKRRFKTNFGSEVRLEDVGLHLIYSNDFEHGLSSLYTLAPEPLLAWRGGDFAVKIENVEIPTAILLDASGDAGLVAQIDLKAPNSTTLLGLGLYSVILDPSGFLTLYRADQPVHHTPLEQYSRGQWHTLRLSAVGSEINVSLDDSLISTFVDDAPLPVYDAYFGAQSIGGDGLLVDNLRLWSPLPPTAVAPDLSLPYVSDYTLSPGEVIVFYGTIAAQSGIIILDHEGTRLLPVLGDKFDPPLPGDNQLESLSDPRLSYDGSKVAFRCAIRNGSTLTNDICAADVLPRGTTNPDNFANLQRLTEIGDVSRFGGWSTTDYELVYTRDQSSGHAYILDATSSGASPEVLTVPDYIMDVTWGKDGSIYASSGVNGEIGPDPYVINPSEGKGIYYGSSGGTFSAQLPLEDYPIVQASKQCPNDPAQLDNNPFNLVPSELDVDENGRILFRTRQIFFTTNTNAALICVTANANVSAQIGTRNLYQSGNANYLPLPPTNSTLSRFSPLSPSNRIGQSITGSTSVIEVRDHDGVHISSIDLLSTKIGAFSWHLVPSSPKWFVVCSPPMSPSGNGSRLNVRSSPTFGNVIVNDNIIGQLNVGEEVQYIQDVSGTVLYLGDTYQFAEIRYQNQAQVRYIARTITYPNGSTGHFFVQGLDPACPHPQPESEIDPFDPERRQYFELYSAAAFFAIYHETSENQYQDRFDIVDAHFDTVDPQSSASLVAYPLPSFYTETGLPRTSSGFSNPALNGLDRRDHRYLQARIIVANVPEFTTNDSLNNGQTGLYNGGFNYLLRWASTFQVTEQTMWTSYGLSCLDVNKNPTIGTYATVYETGNGFDKLKWIEDYLQCRLSDPEQPKFAAVYNAISKYVLLAVEDQIAVLPNPISLRVNREAQSQVKVANTCFVDPPACTEGNEQFGSGVDIVAFCNQEGRDCKDRAEGGYFDSYGNVSAASITMSNWLNEYSPPTVRYPFDHYNDPGYIAPVRDVRTQLVYRTRVGYNYFVTVGLYNDNNAPRFLLMGLGMEKLPQGSDSDITAFDRHWSRLNYRGPATGQTYRPAYCINGLSHTQRIEGLGDIKTWTTFIYQLDDNFVDGDNWFCAEG